MLAKRSEIQLQNFAVLQSNYQYIPTDEDPQTIQKVFDEYDIDIDFTHRSGENNEIQVFTKLSINNSEKTLPGYSLFIEGAGIFFIDPNQVSKKEEEINLKYYSTISILLGYLRNSLSNMTASAPLGPYILPPIDLSDLFMKKNEKAGNSDTK